MLRGEPLSWDLQREVALIDDSIWEAGPEEVAKKIAEIEARFELLQRIDELEMERETLIANRHGIGGNQPPEPIDDPDLARNVTIIWDATSKIKAEVEKDTPDKTVVLMAIDALGASLKWLLAFCGRRIENAIDTVITIGMGAGAVYVIDPAKVERVIEAARLWLRTF